MRNLDRSGTNNEVDRITWIKKTLSTIAPGSTILDAGAGECPYKVFCSHLNYISQDFAQYTGSGTIGLQTGNWDNSSLDIVSDITDIPLPDASVDAILRSEVFEHLPSPLLALKEFSRLLKPSGHLLITAPFASLTHFAPYHFSSGFSRFFYEHHLPLFGFQITELDFNGNFFEFIAQENRRIESVAEKYSATKLNWLERKIIQYTLNMLHKLSAKDKNSKELLCFGFHVAARKLAQ